MPSFVQFQSAALLRRMAALADLPRSRAFYSLRQKIASAVVKGNREGLLAGTDGRGRPLKPLISKRKGVYKGATGPPLVPSRERSRAIANFRATWTREGRDWALQMGWRDVESKKGVPFLIYHLTGGKHLPRRDIAGIRPRTWAEVRRFYADLLPEILQKK